MKMENVHCIMDYNYYMKAHVNIKHLKTVVPKFTVHTVSNPNFLNLSKHL